MSIRIDPTLCNGCGNMAETRCMTVCPGDLLYKDVSINKCVVREPRDCWDCAACLKECPRQAMEMYLSPQIGGRGSTLKARKEKGLLVWVLTKPDGSTEKFEIQVRNGNW